MSNNRNMSRQMIFRCLKIKITPTLSSIRQWASIKNVWFKTYKLL